MRQSCAYLLFPEAHAVGGIVGALLTGVFAINEYGGTSGLIEGNAAQMINQVQGIVIVFVYDAIVSLILLKIIDAVIGLRVSDEIEREGLDLALHADTIWKIHPNRARRQPDAG